MGLSDVWPQCYCLKKLVAVSSQLQFGHAPAALLPENLRSGSCRRPRGAACGGRLRVHSGTQVPTQYIIMGITPPRARPRVISWHEHVRVHAPSEAPLLISPADVPMVIETGYTWKKRHISQCRRSCKEPMPRPSPGFLSDGSAHTARVCQLHSFQICVSIIVGPFVQFPGSSKFLKYHPVYEFHTAILQFSALVHFQAGSTRCLD